MEWTSKGMVQMLERLKTSSLIKETRNQLADSFAKANQNVNHHLKMICLFQAVHNISQYLTMTDWKTLKGPTTPVADVMLTLAQRLKHMGVTSMKEMTQKTSVAMVLWAKNLNGKTLLSGPAIYQLSQDMTAVSQATAPAVDAAQGGCQLACKPKGAGREAAGEGIPRPRRTSVPCHEFGRICC